MQEASCTRSNEEKTRKYKLTKEAEKKTTKTIRTSWSRTEA